MISGLAPAAAARCALNIWTMLSNCSLGIDQ
jgi:hypothetical protein